MFEEYLDIDSFEADLIAEGCSYKEVQEEIWILKEEYKQGGLKSEYIKTRKVL